MKHDFHKKLQDALNEKEDLCEQIENKQAEVEEFQKKLSREKDQVQQLKNKFDIEGACHIYMKKLNVKKQK